MILPTQNIIKKKYFLSRTTSYIRNSYGGVNYCVYIANYYLQIKQKYISKNYWKSEPMKKPFKVHQRAWKGCRTIKKKLRKNWFSFRTNPTSSKIRTRRPRNVIKRNIAGPALAQRRNFSVKYAFPGHYNNPTEARGRDDPNKERGWRHPSKVPPNHCYTFLSRFP